MKIELVQLTGRDGDTAYNLDRTLQAIATCAEDTDLLIFPETQLMGFASAVMVNRVGDGDEGLVFAGGSTAIDPFGRTLFEAGRAECRQVVELDLELLRTARRDYDDLSDRRLLLTGKQIEHEDGRRELLIP
ncbi:Carbon-nitrogen hydrolase [Pseudomonas sp. IT-P253]|jgi:predicted amidohydrolase|uniref:hypothetical protein n=1 Tax=Pseudomonas sp. IT-P253 TaxID=3026455 RepID=UPI0039E02131